MKQLKTGLTVFLVFQFMIGSAAVSKSINLFENPGFEKKEADLWKTLDSCRIALNGKNAHSGKRSLAFYPLKDGAGIRLDLSGRVQPGYGYVFSGWVRNSEAGWGQADFSLTCRQPGETRDIVIGRADCNKDNWTRISNSFFVPEQAEKTGIDLVIKTAWGRIAFLVDDVELRPELSIAVNRPFPQAGPELVFHIGPRTDERGTVQVRAQCFDPSSQPVQKWEGSLDAPMAPALPPGFYRVAADVHDLDGRLFRAEKIFHVGALPRLVKSLDDKTGKILLSETLARYHGWIRYLQYRSSDFSGRDGDESDRALQALFRLDTWTRTIMDNPAVLDTLSGVHEWAYLSRVDDSGQPFKIAVPTGYDAARQYPLIVVMHGYGGNHMEYSGGVRSNPGYFQLDVLGRGRGGGYRNLSESDVLDAVDYVRENWSIDDDRIHPTGASMGGGGTFLMATRYPDRWASGRPVCGYGLDLPIANALHVPFYSTHSVDDPSVAVLSSRAPLKKLSGLGGQVVIDETIGLQHAAWNYTEGNDRAFKWMFSQVRPDWRDVRHIDFTAVDRLSCKAYWLKIGEWGGNPGPARFKASAGLDNQLYLSLDNIRTLTINVSRSPFEPGQALKISVNAGRFITMEAPLPDSIFVTLKDGAWSAVTRADGPFSFELHTPGGVHNLYHHDPLLIVYGTGGNDKARQAMESAAAAASKSYNPMWVGEGGDIKEGVPGHHLLYGRLKMKPDSAVTEMDMKNCHLLLIGRAHENGIVRKMGPRLPVQFGKDIVCSDSVRFEGEKAVMGLYFYNPLSPHRLIYWVAADSPDSYKPYPLLFQLQENPNGMDFFVVREDPFQIIKVRHFDSRWNWSDPFKNSAYIPEQEIHFGDLFRKMAESIRSATNSDFTLMSVNAPEPLQAGVPGLLQWADIASLFASAPIAVMEIKGSILLSHQQGFSAAGNRIRLYPPGVEKTDPEKVYRVALLSSGDVIRQWINQKGHVPDPFSITDVTLFEAMEKSLF